ncbi:MAG: hypothetical protein Q8Q59_09725 [Luteolibacter sp.]|jgi:hypothetical protein|nr:hypothetical protein [Luteolibacter sp.]
MKTRSIITAIALLVSPSLFADDTTKKEEAKPYKPDTCIVSDEKLGEMGKPYVFVHDGQEIKLCCKSCLKKFNKEPDKYLKKLVEKK